MAPGFTVAHAYAYAVAVPWSTIHIFSTGRRAARHDLAAVYQLVCTRGHQNWVENFDGEELRLRPDHNTPSDVRTIFATPPPPQSPQPRNTRDNDLPPSVYETYTTELACAIASLGVSARRPRGYVDTVGDALRWRCNAAPSPPPP